MLITLHCVDPSGQPVPGAVLTFYKNGVAFDSLQFPSNTGVLYFETDEVAADLLTAAVMWRVTAPGFTTSGSSGSDVAGYSDYTYTIRKNGLNTAVIVGAGAGAVLLFAFTKKNKGKISGIDPKRDVLPWLPVAGIVIVGGILLKKFFGQSAEDKAREDAINNDIANSGSGYLTDSEISTIANQLKEDLGYSAVSNDTTDAARQLTKVFNLNDLLRLIKAYGTHVITFFGIPTGTYTLEETVTRQMSTDEINEVNAYYDAQGINFKF